MLQYTYYSMQSSSGPSEVTQSSCRLPPLQENMFLQGMRDSGLGIYLQQLVARRDQALHAASLRRAFDELVARHAALRCSFFFDDAARIALRRHARASVPITVEDLSALAGRDQEQRFEAFLKADRLKGFDSGDMPLMRVAVFRLGENQHRIVWTSHHAIMDGRSRVIALQELFALEALFLNNRSPSLDPAPDYGNYLEWLTRLPPFRSRAFWKAQLEGIVEPTVIPRPVSTAARGWGMQVLDLDEETTSRLRRISQLSGVTLNTFLQAAWAIFLSRHSGSEDVLFGATRACRHLEGVDVKRMVGLLINTVPIRVKPCRTIRLGDFLRSLHQLWTALRDHEHTPLESIHEWCGFNAASPLFHSIVVFEKGTLHDLVSPDDASWDCDLHQRTGVPLTLSAFDGKSLRMELHYDGERYGAEDAAHFLALLNQLFISMIDGADRPIGELSMLSHAERERVVVEWNQTFTDFPSQTRVEELFAEQARRTPTATALMHNGRTISYEELNAQADSLCDRLIAGGLETGGRVAVAMDRSPGLMIAMLAILKAGCAYVPMETNAPGSRAQAILRQVRPHLLLIEGAGKVSWIGQSSGIKLVDLSIDHHFEKTAPRRNFAGQVHDAAYVMFTSGSTGVPKGVVVPHRAIVRLVKDTNYCKISSEDVIGHLSNPAFDASTFEVWGPLLNGGAVSIIEAEIALSATELREKIETDHITALWLTTALFNEFAREQPGIFRGLRYLLTGGEKVSPAAFAAVAGACPHLRLLNGYGPTETTTFASTFQYDSGDSHGESIPIGRPIANTTIYILDERGEPVPVGVPGEIHIGGPGVALGYFDDAELTKQRFIPDPFDPGPSGLLYRSGDMGRFLLDGDIEFLGRADQQIKLRGFRIEPAEIEKALAALEEISGCAVLGRFEQGTCVGLSAFVTLNRPATAREDQKIAAQLTASLPSYMVPDCITILDRFPVNANGKVDRAALAGLSAPAATSKPLGDFPPTETQSVLLAIWRELLAKDQIGLDDNFFALGGHSIRAVRCLLQIQRRLGISLAPSTLFATPTIRGLASKIAALPSVPAPAVESETIEAADEAVRPATDTEQFIWEYNRQNQHPEILNISRAIRITGPLQTGALEVSIRQMLLRHAPLRTRFFSTSGNLTAELIAAPNFSLPVEDLASLPPEERAAHGHAAYVENTCRPFDLASDLLLRARLLKFHEEDFLLLVAVHHIVADGWSLEILRRDLFVTYESLINSVPNPLPPLRLNLGSLALLQKSRSAAAIAAQLAEWKQRLAAPLPSLDRLFRQPPATDAPEEPSCWAADAKLTASQTQALQILAQKHEVTLFVLLLAIYDLLLAQRTGNWDVIVGTALAGRQHLGADDLVGTFIQPIPLRVNLTGCTHFNEVLQRVKHSANLAHEGDPLPLGKLAALVPGRNPPRSNPIFDTALNHYEEDPTHDFCPTGLQLTVLPNPVPNAKLPLGFYSLLKPEGLSLRMCSQSKFFTQEQTDQLLEQFVQLSNHVITNPDLPLAASFCPASEDPASEPAFSQSFTATQAILHGIWRDVLAVSKIDLDDNFFALGGHSLRAVRCLLQVHRKLGVSLPMVALFESPTIRGLAEQIEAAATLQPELPSMGAGNGALGETRPATAAEQRFLDHLSNRPHPEDLIISRGFRICGPLREDLLEKSLFLVLRRHAPLRTLYKTEQGRGMAVPVLLKELYLSILDLSDLPPKEQETRGEEIFFVNSHRPFEIAEDLPLRARLLKFGEEDHLLLLAIHHIVADGWTLDILRRDLFNAYQALADGEDDPLPPLGITFDMIAESERERVPEFFNQRLAIWKQRLAPPLPTIDSLFRRQPAALGQREAPFPAATVTLSAAETRAIPSLASKQETTIFLLLLSVYDLLLSRLTGNADVIVGTVVAGRTAPGAADVAGTFAHNLPLRTDLAGCNRFDQVLCQVMTTVREAFEDEGLPFGKIVALVPEKVPPRSNPIFDTTYGHFSEDTHSNKSPRGLTISVLGNPIKHTKVALTFNSFLRGERMELSLCGLAKFFSQEQIERLLDQFVYLLQQILENPDRTLSEYSLVTPMAKSALPDPSAGLLAPFYEPVAVSFSHLATVQPHAPAVMKGRDVLSYHELDTASDCLARRLLANGLKTGVTVAVHAHACLALPVCVLAVFKAGGVLLLVDLSLPFLRKRLIMQEGRARFLLEVSAGGPSDLTDGKCIRMELDPDASKWCNGAVGNLPLPPIRPEDPACIFFTSGTTGVPNAVVFSHQGLSHFISWQRTRFEISHHARVAQMTRLSFDVILRDLFLPLTSGGACCIPEARLEEHPGHVLEWLKSEKITVLHAVPTRAQSWLSNIDGHSPTCLPALRHIFFSGEPLHETDVNAWREVAPNAKIINLYGPTETTLVKSFCEVPTPAPCGIQSLGQPLPESQVLVLDQNLRLCGIGEPGEIVIRTPFRSLGYLNASELQQQRFVRNPHSNDPDDLLYLTGDVGKFDTEGNIEYLGRRDHQVKINGVRVEPSEVVSVILSLAGVRSCHVLAAPGPDNRLALLAFIVPASGVVLTSAAVRNELADRLPATHLPSRIRILKDLPINPNGKVDARALLALVDDEIAELGPKAESHLEKMIIEVFSFVLNRGSIHRDDDFFEIGGHSLLAMRVVARLSELLGHPVSIRLLLTNTTPALLAAVLEISTVVPMRGKANDAVVGFYPPDSTVHSLFSEQVRRTPNAVAAVDDHGSITFEELDSLSGHLAMTLRNHGVGLEQRVAVVVHRSLEMIVGLMGILKAGAVYVPIDPREPLERLRQILEDCGASAVVSTSGLFDGIPSDLPRILAISPSGTNDSVLSAHQKAALPSVSPGNGCYVIYTSGSTGKPKGVVVEHRQVIAYHNAFFARTDWKGTGCAALLQPLSVDSTVTLLFPPLLNGGTLRLISETAALDPHSLADAFATSPIDHLKIAPSHLEALLESNFADKILPRQFLFLGGEVASANLLEKLRNLQPSCRVFNHYGPTETTVGISMFEIKDWHATHWPLPIGRPMAHARFHILDGNFQPMPQGEAGGLYVGGPAVTRGYLCSPGLTARAFIPDPFSHEPGARLYCTGDQACELPDGNFQFLGRDDNQIKIRGRRIDPREIEIVLESHPHVKRALVLPTKHGASSPVLSAFLVTESPGSVTTDAVREFLQARLPAALIPSRFIALAALPRTGHGKVDLNLLSAMEEWQEGAVQTSAMLAENQTVEARLAALWQRLLGVRQFESAQDFFELGGHSLLATHLASLINQDFGIHLPLQEILSGPTLGVMAKNISEKLADANPASNAVTSPTSAHGPPSSLEELPLLPTQEGMWFFEHVQGSGGPAYHINYIWRLTGPLDRRALEASWNQLVERHEALRSIFLARSGRPYQVIKPFAPFAISFIDLHGLPSASREAESLRCANEWLQAPLDPAIGPLHRMALIAITAQEHLFAFSAHHLITDGWSMGVLYRELELLYAANVGNSGLSLPALSQSYGDYVLQQTEYYRSPAYRKRLTDWCETFRGITNALPVPADFPRQSLQTFRGEILRRNLSSQVRDRLFDLSKKERATPNIVFLSGLCALLHQLTGSEQVAVGSAIAARTTHHVERMVGCLINTIVNRGDLSGSPSFRELIQRSRATFMETLSHQDVPFGDIVRQLGGSRNADRSPLFQVNLTYQNSAMGSRFTLQDLAVESILPEQFAAKFDLAFSVLENHEPLVLSLIFNKDLFRCETATEILDRFVRLLETVSLNQDVPLNELFPPQSGPSGRVCTVVPQDHCLHRLIEDQAVRTPHALAVAMGEEQLNYAQLDAASNALAHRLLEMGVGSESIVAVYLTRSAEAMVTLVGILKAGAAYLPLDLADPAPRLAHALMDSQARVLISERALEDRLHPAGLATLWIDEEWKSLLQSSAPRPLIKVHPKSLAALFYTSGSTGKPKGVAVQHDNLVNFAVTFARRHQLQSTDRVAQLTALSFDVSGEEIWPALVAGSSVHVGCEALKAMPENLLEWLNLREITICDLATPLAEVTMDDQMHRAKTLRLLITGGDRLRKWPKRPLPCKFINAYGPTETTIFSTNAEISLNSRDGAMPPIGRALEKQSVYLLDGAFEPVADGAPGEIFIGGAGVTRGYFRNPAATADRFIPDPFSGQPGARLYRTGDLARILPNGQIDFIGRIDNQFQIRGFRVELGEIEAALAAHPAVALAAVTIQEDDAGTPFIIAHAVTKQGESLGFVPLREFLSQRLPGHMIPARLAVHDQFPLTASGKILRSALPAVDLAQRHVDADYVQPSSETEQALARFLGGVLGTASVGLDDNFFDLGGHSLLIIQMLSHLKERYGLELPIDQFYAHATVRGLARMVEAQPAPVPPAPPKPVSSDDPLRRIERRPLLSLFATRKLPPVDAAFIAYFQSSLYSSTGLTKRQIMDEWYDGMPTFRMVRQTSIGTTGGIFLPRCENDLYEEPARLVEQLVESLELAGSIGATFVSLTGLIPSATAYGESLAAAIAGRNDLPQITTGHATTGCTVALSMRRILEESGRDLEQECLGFLGLGSIGLTSLELILEVLPHPAEIILCDLFMKRPLMEATSRKLREEIGFKGRIEILDAQAGMVPEAFYRARAIVGATNVPSILDLKLLRSGTVIVDDSAPHCFDSETAMERIREQGDLLVTEGGLVKLPDPAPIIIYRPEFIEKALRSARLDQPFQATEITGCVLSALLNAADPSLPVTIGRVPMEASRRHYRKLEELGFQPAGLRCLGESIDDRIIESFRKRFGQHRD